MLARIDPTLRRLNVMSVDRIRFIFFVFFFPPLGIFIFKRLGTVAEHISYARGCDVSRGNKNIARTRTTPARPDNNVRIRAIKKKKPPDGKRARGGRDFNVVERYGRKCSIFFFYFTIMRR